ncbi:putative HEPN_AbiU2 domain-containing protein [Pseudomonas sp. IT-P100]|uniref:DUF5677 domain-containing protein n=1 Tax=Pseudomonas sp. IT-P100 TaxID=3026452 RepID=UPI0039DFA3C6
MWLADLESKCQELLLICSRMVAEVKGGEFDDLRYMCHAFFLRQIQHMKSILLLKGECDSQLVSRSMFEGALYLMYAGKECQIARRWRLYCIVVDKQKMDEAELNGISVPSDIKRIINENIVECDELFKCEDGQYINNWREGESIYSIVKKVGFEKLYDQYYFPMSDYHHWGTVSVGKRYAIIEGGLRQVDSSVTESDRISSLLLALSCLLSTADFAESLFSCNERVALNKFKFGLSSIPRLVVDKVSIKAGGS